MAVLVGGVLIDKLGTRKASLMFSVLVFAGAAIVCRRRACRVLHRPVVFGAVLGDP